MSIWNIFLSIFSILFFPLLILQSIFEEDIRNSFYSLKNKINEYVQKSHKTASEIAQQDHRPDPVPMNIIVPAVIDHMVTKFGLEEREAMRELYASRLYANLECESFLRYFNPQVLAYLWYLDKYPKEA